MATCVPRYRQPKIGEEGDSNQLSVKEYYFNQGNGGYRVDERIVRLEISSD